MTPSSERQESNLRLLITSEAFTISATFRYAPYPQRCVLLPHCQTAAFSGFSLDWFSGYQQEEDSFVPAVHPLHEGLGPTWLNANRRDLRITANLSGLTWEDTTASERQESNLLSGYSPVSAARPLCTESRLPCSVGVLLPITRPCGKAPNALRSEVGRPSKDRQTVVFAPCDCSVPKR